MPAAELHFDYVVVGSGAGGGTVAVRLAEAGARVLVLEAGSDAEDLDYRVPGFHGRATESPAYSWEFFVRHYADEAQQRRDSKYVGARGGVFYPRAATVGGCTAHNAMITIYPSNLDWDGIAELTGDGSWRSERMRTYFERLERCGYAPRPRALPRNRLLAAILSRLPVVSDWYRNASRHGYDGWLATSMARPEIALKDPQLVEVLLGAVEAELARTLGRPLTTLERFGSYVDPNDWRVQQQAAEGLWLVPMAVDHGRRNGTREALRAAQRRYPGNLTIRTSCLATRVLLDSGNRAVGVEYLEGAHLYGADPDPDSGRRPATRQATAGQEVVLAGGAFNTPQLLMLSGVGPAEELDRHGIPVRVDLPGVGRNLQDRYEVGVVTECDDDFALLEDLRFRPPAPGERPDRALVEWERDGSGVYATNGVVLGITRRSRREEPVPDLFIFGLPARFSGYYPGYSADLERNRNHFTWAILKAHTANTGGVVRLRSADPRDVPDINFHYFEEGSDAAGRDLDAVATGIEFVRNITRRVGVVTREVLPGDAVSGREALRAYVRDQAWGHHASCTCRMGPPGDPMAVTDSSFRVVGTTGLRVVDASVFPRIPGYFIVTPVYMIAEKASEALLADRGAASPAQPPATARRGR